MLDQDNERSDEVRFWQSVALALTLFSLGLIGSLIISLIVMLLVK